MTDQEIKESYERDGYVVIKDLIDDHDLDPMRKFIKAKVDEYAREEYGEGKLSSLYEDESFERRYAAICEEQGISPRGWSHGSFGREFYDLYNLRGTLRVLSLIQGPEISNLCIHTSKLNTAQGCRWSIDFRHFPTPDRAALTPRQREEAEFVQSKSLKGGRVPLIVLSRGHKPTWEEWEAEVLRLRAA